MNIKGIEGPHDLMGKQIIKLARNAMQQFYKSSRQWVVRIRIKRNQFWQ